MARPLTPEEKDVKLDQFLSLYRKGVSESDILDIVGISKTTSHRWKNKHLAANERRSPRASKHTIAKAQRLYEKGVTVPIISSVIGAAEGTIHKWAKKFAWDRKSSNTINDNDVISLLSKIVVGQQYIIEELQKINDHLNHQRKECYESRDNNPKSQ